MDRARLLKFIRESKQHLKESSPEQKIKILKLIKEARQQLVETGAEKTPVDPIVTEDNSSNNVDYLEEK